jgi:hypothetical protein
MLGPMVALINRSIAKRMTVVASLAVIVLTSAMTSNAIAAGGGNISGKVTDSKGTALANAQVTASEARGFDVASATTNSSGEYTIGSLPAGSYRVKFIDSPYLTQYYNDKTSFSEADLVPVEAEKTHTGIDATMHAFGNISGKVTDNNGKALFGVQVTIFLASGGWFSTQTNFNGEYMTAALPTGSYKVEFSGSFGNAFYLTQYYSGKSSLSAADPVAVELDKTHEHIDATMLELGRIRGKVTDTRGTPLEGIQVIAIGADGGQRSGGTNQSGEYSIEGLPTGSYKVEFTSSSYLTQYYNGKASLSEADPVSVVVEGRTVGIDATMHESGRLSGKVTDTHGNALPNVFVTVLDSSGNFVASGGVNSSGEYTIGGLPAGSYKVEFQSSRYLTQYYDNKGSLSESDPVLAEEGKTHEGIDAAMHELGKISGKVTDIKGNPLGNIYVSLVDEHGNPNGVFVATNSSGEYTIEALPSGAYRVAFFESFIIGFPGGEAPGYYITQFYNDKSSAVEADPVAVEADKTHEHVDAAMHEHGKISGKVTDGKGKALTNVQVTVFNLSGFAVTTGFTNSSGEYTIGGLPTGSYKVGFTREPYLTQYYSGKYSLAEADAVSAAVDSTHSGIDATMHEGGKISGKVTDGHGNALAGIQVTILSLAGRRTGVVSAMTNSSGEYTVAGVPAGSYTVEFSSPLYLTQYYNGKASISEADPVAVEVDSTHTGIDAAMHEGGGISGKVTDSKGAALAGVRVTIIEGGVSAATTNGGGEYTIGGVPAGSYAVEFSSPSYPTQYFNGKFSLSEADPVVVEAEKTRSGIDAMMASAPSSLAANSKSAELVGTHTGTGPPSSSQSSVGGAAPTGVDDSATTKGARVAFSGPLSIRAGVVFVPLRCLSKSSCLSLTVKIVVVERVVGARANDHRTTAPVVIAGRTGVTLGVGQSRTLRISLNRVGKRLLSRSRRVMAQARVTSNGYTVASQRIGLGRAPLASHARATPTSRRGAL